MWVVIPMKEIGIAKDILKTIKGEKPIESNFLFPFSLIPVAFLNGKYPNYLMFIPEVKKEGTEIGLNGGLFMDGFKYSLNITKDPLSPLQGKMNILNSPDDLEFEVVIMPVPSERTE